MGNFLEDYLWPGHPADDISQEMINCVERIVVKDHLVKVRIAKGSPNPSC